MLKFLLGLLKPFINREITYVVADLTAAAPAIQAQAAAAGTSAVAAVEAYVATALAKQPLIASIADALMPLVSSFLAGLAAKGATDVPDIISAVAAFLTKEEAYF
jgi:hypothetical protein